MEINNLTHIFSGYPVSIAINLNGNTAGATQTSLIFPVIRMEAIKLKSTHKPKLTTHYPRKTTKHKPTRTTYHPVTMETTTMAPSSDVWVLDLTWDDATWLVKLLTQVV